MSYIVNGSIISDDEFEYLKKYNTDKLNKKLLPTEIAFIIVILLITMFIISYGVYDAMITHLHVFVIKQYYN